MGSPQEAPRPPFVYAGPVPDWCVGWVYLIETDATYQKLGFSVSPHQRFKEFTKLPFAAWVAHLFPVGQRAIEGRLHSFFRPRWCRGEWFQLWADGVAFVKSLGPVRDVAALRALLPGPTCRAVVEPSAGLQSLATDLTVPPSRG